MLGPSQSGAASSLWAAPFRARRFGFRADPFRREIGRSEILRRAVMSYVQAFMVQSSQLVLCNTNTRHSTDERVARWLLVARDRLDANEIPVTHELLGRVLGIRRASATEAVGRLERAGSVRAERGCVAILDRQKLEQSSCACYRAIRSEYDRMPVPTRRRNRHS